MALWSPLFETVRLTAPRVNRVKAIQTARRAVTTRVAATAWLRAKAQFEKASPATWLRWYRTHLRTLKAHSTLAERRLDAVTNEIAADFAARRQSEGLQTSSINSSLRVLRRLLRVAVEWGVIPSAPKIKLLRGENHRERVITPAEEAKYLAAAPEPLASIATILLDSGMRPEECFRLRWESITWINGRYGSLLVTHGKTAAARRVLPMTPRVRTILEGKWERVGKPLEGWIWDAPTAASEMCAARYTAQRGGLVFLHSISLLPPIS